MAGNPRENIQDKGFWDGGAPAHNADGQSAGRPSGFPGVRKPGRAGIRTSIDAPANPKPKTLPDR